MLYFHGFLIYDIQLDYPNSSEVFREFCKARWKSLGYDHPLCRGAAGYLRAIETCLELYGVERAIQTQRVKDKVVQTNIERYGFPHAKQSEAWWKLNKHKFFKAKKIVLDSGKEIFVQGYEAEALQYLLLVHGYREEDFDFENPTSFWYTLGGKDRRYYPDFIVPKKRVLYEVKSTYFLTHDTSKIKAKCKAVMEQGWAGYFLYKGKKKTPIKAMNFSDFLNDSDFERIQTTTPILVPS
jgi:hypothetical protein